MNVGVDSYTLKMIEQVTGPLKAINAQVEKVAGSMDRLSKITTAAFATGAVVMGIKAVSGAIGGLLSVMSAGAGVAYRFGEAVVKATMFRQRNVPALDVLLGKGRGEGVFQNALRIGGLTSASELDVVNQVKALAGAGYSGGALNRVNAALLDVQALGGNEAMSSLAYYFQKFKGGLSVERDDLRMAAATAGIQERDLLKSMVGLAGGDTTGSDAALAKQVEAMKKAGKLNGQVAAEALLQAIKGKLDEGGPLGSFAKKMGKGSLAGLLSNLEDAPTRFLAQMKLEKLPGVQSFMRFLERLLVFFDHATPQGRELARVITDITNALFGGFDKITGEDLGRFFRAGVKVAEQMVVVIQKAWDWITKILNAKSPWTEILASTGTLFLEVGRMIGVGIKEGVLNWDGLNEQTGGAGLTWDPALVKNVAPRPEFQRELVAESTNTGAKVREGLFESFRKAGQDLGLIRKQGPTTINVGGITVNGAMSEEQAEHAVSSLESKLRQSRQRLGAAAGGEE